MVSGGGVSARCGGGVAVWVGAVEIERCRKLTHRTWVVLRAVHPWWWVGGLVVWRVGGPTGRWVTGLASLGGGGAGGAGGAGRAGKFGAVEDWSGEMVWISDLPPAVL